MVKTAKTSRTPDNNVSDPKTPTVQIFVEDGKLTVDKATVRVPAGGMLTFRIHPDDQTLTSFVVLMIGGTPFGSGLGWAGSEKGPGVKMRIDGSANNPNGDGTTTESKYSYCVMASDGTKSYSMDPDVIVGPPQVS